MFRCSLGIPRLCRLLRVPTSRPLLRSGNALFSTAPIFHYNYYPGRKKGLEGDELIAESLRLHGYIAKKKEKVDLGQYWKLNYQLTRWLNTDHTIGKHALNLHKSLAAKHTLDFTRPDNRRLFESGFAKRWERVSHWKKLEKLSLLIGCLAHSASATLQSLQNDPRPPRFVGADCLYNLRHARWEEIQADPKVHQWFVSQVRNLFRTSAFWQSQRISDRHFALMMEFATETEQRQMLSTYEKHYSEMTDSTLLYFVDCYTRLGEVDMAMSYLRRVHPELLQRKDGEVKPRYSVIARCLNLLRLETLLSEGDEHSFKVLPAILQLGVPPHDLMYGMVAKNALKLELPNVAWSVYRGASEQGFKMPPYVMQKLLKDAFLRQDVPALDETLSAIQERPELLSHWRIATYTMHIVRSICFYQEGLGSGTIVTRILGVYDKGYNRKHLTEVGIIRPDEERLGNPELPDPASLTLAFSIFFYVMVQRDSFIVDKVWEKLKKQIEEGNDVVLQAAQHPVFYDGFIGFYARHERTIAKGLGILRYMLATKICAPGDITWSRTIGMLLQHHKNESAEKIRLMMLRRRVPVTEKAWEFVLRKYPYTKTALEVKKILGLLPDAAHESGEHSIDRAADTANITVASSRSVGVNQDSEDIEVVDTIEESIANVDYNFYTEPTEQTSNSLREEDDDQIHQDVKTSIDVTEEQKAGLDHNLPQTRSIWGDSETFRVPPEMTKGKAVEDMSTPESRANAARSPHK